MNRSEAKFKNTSAKMNKALMTLLETKDFTDITIMDICKLADVNRSTFYAHYDNTYELLKEAKENLIKNFSNECNFDNPVDFSNMKNLTTEDLNFVSPKYLIPYLQYVEKHKRLFKIYANNSFLFQSDETEDQMIEDIFVPILAKHGVEDKKLVCYMQKYFLKGINAIINEWIKNDCEDDILFICEIIIFCIRPA